ncbi:hypothetical protein HII31_06406 [Pseudocercospora fuligena]|uniref:Uncharacterized protein n=1 Tax=Pseudocercospora fuligena TaxID=685502 RepID=A0A8H6VLE9_9PEZI|nr:hypothetical protein HII31_06406 [Pseudocercospora fuligena]
MPPHCEPDNSGPECAILWFGSNINELSNETVDSRILYAACGDAIDGGLPCLIQGGPARLVYFPVTTTNGGFCAGNGSTVTRTDAPSVVSALGTEFTSGTAYVSFETLYAAFRPSQADKAGALQIGPTFSNAIFSFRSDEISTNCYTRGFGGLSDEGAFGTGTQLNFADLNYPISASAYQCQDQCYSVSSSVCYNTSIGGGPVTIGSSVSYSTLYGCSYSYVNYPDAFCSTIWDNFNPLLAVPTRLRELAPEWSTCSFWHDRQPNVIFDPPTALHQVDAAATPTSPNAAATIAASPSPTVTPIVGPTGTMSQDEPSPATNVGTVPTASNPEPIAVPNDDAPQNNGPLTRVELASSPDSPFPSSSALEQDDPSSSAVADPVSFILEHLTDLSTMSTQRSEADSNTIAAADTDQDFTIAFSTASTSEITAVRSIGAAIWTPSIAAADPVADIDLGNTTVQATLFGGSALAVGGSTIAIGQAATVGDALLSFASSGVAVHIPTATSDTNILELPKPTGTIAILPIGNDDPVTASFREDGKTVVVDGTILSIGGSAATINGKTVTLVLGGVVVGGSTYAPTPATALDHFSSATALVTLPGNGGVVTATFDANSHVAEVAGQTVTLGGAAVTIDGLAASLASDGLVINSRTYAPTSAATAPGELTTLFDGDHTFTGAFFSSKGLVGIGGTRLTVGGSAITFDGVVITAATNGLKTLSSGSQSGHQTSPSSTPASSSNALPSAVSTSTSRSAAAAKHSIGFPTLAILVVLLPSLLGVCEHIL